MSETPEIKVIGITLGDYEAVKGVKINWERAMVCNLFPELTGSCKRIAVSNAEGKNRLSRSVFGFV